MKKLINTMQLFSCNHFTRPEFVGEVKESEGRKYLEAMSAQRPNCQIKGKSRFRYQGEKLMTPESLGFTF